MLRRVSWSAVLAGLLTLLSVSAAVAEERDMAIALGLSAITWAILSLREQS